MSNEKKQESDWEMVKSFLIAVLIALVFRSFAFEPFHIPSGSMLSTLYEGDYIFVSKYSYGYSRYSFPLGLPPLEGRILKSGSPQRGDVVVFREPSNLHIDFIKRIIGLPGDTVQMRHGRLYINDAPVETTRDGDVTVPNRFGEQKAIARYLETLPGGKIHIILDEVNEGPADNTAPYTVPEGQYFMMGDNRDNSQDSRYPQVGFVPEENIVGRAQVVLLSFNGEVPLWKIWRLPFAFRNNRWFLKIV